MPARFKFGMGRCCCGSCVIATNDFEENLDNMTGTGDIAGGLLVLDAGEQEIFNDGAATEDDGQHLITTADTSASTATARLEIARVDDDNYLFGDFAIAAGAGTIRLGQRSGGADNYLSTAETIADTGANLTDAHELTLCFEPGEAGTPSNLSFVAFPSDVTSHVGWTDPDNVLDDDGNLALFSMVGPAPATAGLVVQFATTAAIPSGSTIDGIIVEVETGQDGSSSDLTLSCELTIAGASNTKGPISITTFLPQSFGDTDDTWTLNPTPASINTGPVVVSLTYTDNDTAAAQISVDYIKLVVYYSTGGRDAGVLRFTIKNNGTGEYQCVTSTAASAGLEAGLRSTSGTWEFTSATYSYLQSVERPQCPTCSCELVECQYCEDDDAPSEYVVEIQGVTGQIGTDFNGTWTIPFGGTSTIGGCGNLTPSINCCWYVVFFTLSNPPDPNNPEAYIRVFLTSTADVYVELAANNPTTLADEGYAHFKRTYSPAIPCASLNNTDLPFDNDNFQAAYLDAASATCTISA